MSSKSKNNKSAGTIGCIVLMLISFGPVIVPLFLLFTEAPPAVVAVLSAIAFVLILSHHNKSFKNAGTAKAALDPNASEKAFARRIVLSRLREMTTDTYRPVAKKLIRDRFIVCGAYALFIILFLGFGGLYVSRLFINICIILAVVTEAIFLSLSTEKYIVRAMKKNPQKKITEIVGEVTFNDAETPKLKGRTVAAVLLIPVALGVSLAFNSTPYITTESCIGGVSVVEYRPAFFAMDTISIPEKIDGNTVVSIGENAFSGNSYVKEIRLPDTVKDIGSYAFKDCRALTRITLPKSLEALGGEAFMDCKSLSFISIPEGVKEIRGSTFEGCSALSSINLCDSITDIHARAFFGCSSLRSIDLPEGITEIHANTFEECSALRSVTIPEGVTRIAAHAFYGCSSLSEVNVPDSVKEIGSSAFRLCTSLDEITIPKDCIVNERAFKESPTNVTRKIHE